ncbi:hypothetical protein CL630_01400 [bacterium]|nr:hypothetical protein [bacterium]|tara:strand:- start:19784 stop:20206 length:423 start_codon:yes stop_codon:yes gene_type:complete
MRIINWSTLPVLLGSLGLGLIARMYFVAVTSIESSGMTGMYFAIEPLGVIGILITPFAFGLLAQVRHKKSWIYTHVKIFILMLFAIVLFEISFWSLTPLWLIIGFLLSFYVGAFMFAFVTRRGAEKHFVAQGDGDENTGG